MTYAEDNRKSRTSRLRRAVRAVGVLGATLAVGAICVGAVVLGSDVIAQNAVRISVDEKSAPLAVRVETIQQTASYDIPQTYIGTLEAAQHVDLGFETGGTLSEILVNEGARVAQGQVLARLDTRSLDAQLQSETGALEALDAQLELARLTAQRQAALAERNFASGQRADETRLQVREAQARLAQAQAAIRATQVLLDKAVLRAPFAGQIAARHLDTGARASPTTSVLELLQTDAPLVRVGVAPDVAATLRPDQPIDVTLNGLSTTLHFVSKRADLDPVTRTQTVLLTLPGELPSGVTFGGLVRLDVARQIDTPGFWIPLSALREGNRGLWTLFYLEHSDGLTRSLQESVEVLYADQTRAFVRGAVANGAQVVITGPHRLAPGQIVTALQTEG